MPPLPAGASCATCDYQANHTCHYNPPVWTGGTGLGAGFQWPAVLDSDFCAYFYDKVAAEKERHNAADSKG